MSSGAYWSVFRWQLREGSRSALIWGLPLGAMCVLEVAIYPSVHKSLSKLVADYPTALKEAFNLHDLSTVQAFLDVEMFSLLVPLTVGFFAIRSVLRGTVAAEERGWLDVILTAPVTRTQLVVATCAATLCSLAVMLIAVAVPVEIAGVVVGATVPVGAMLAGLASMWAIGAFFAGVAVVAGSASRRAAVVTGIGAGLLVAMYVVDLVGKIAPSVAAVRWGSVFRYTTAALQNGLDGPGWVAVMLCATALALAGLAGFRRRDIGA